MAVEVKRRGAHLPPIPGWNPDLPLLPHQQTGVVYLYTARRAMLADQVGLGKMIQSYGLIQLLKARGERYRTLVVCDNPVREQWVDEGSRFTDLNVIPAYGPKTQRIANYTSSGWEALITTYQLVIRDYQYLKSLPFDVVVFDESSNFRHHNIITAETVKLLSERIPRIIETDATPVQNSILDMHSQLEALHVNVFGTLAAFERQYIRRQSVKVRRGRTYVSASKIIGYRNLDDFKERVAPFILRRRRTEIEEHLPELMTQDIWLDLPKAQRQRYDQARRGIIVAYEEGRRHEFRSNFHHVQYALDSSAYFGDNPSTSVKLDWLINELLHDLQGEQVIVFSRHRGLIADAIRRMRTVGISVVTFTGTSDRPQVTPNGLELPLETQDQRQENVRIFNAGRAQVLIGTQAIERGLNLQVSAHLFALNQLFNPQRMVQLVGRIRRLGSKHSKVYLHNLLIKGTMEENMMRLLSQRAAISDFVFDEENGIFAGLSDDELYRLIAV